MIGGLDSDLNLEEFVLREKVLGSEFGRKRGRGWDLLV